MLGHLSLDIIYSSANKYPSIFWRQMGAIVYLLLIEMALHCYAGTVNISENFETSLPRRLSFTAKIKLMAS